MSYYYAAGTNQLESTIKHGLFGGTYAGYWHDANGNLAVDTGRKAWFYYDFYNQLDTVLFPGSEDTSYIAFGYTTEGQRIYKDYHYWYLDSCETGGGGIESSGSEGGGLDGGGDSLCVYYSSVATRYVREKLGGKVLAEYVNNPDHPLKFKFIYAGDQRIAMYDQSKNLHFYLNDHLGSARMVIDSTGTVKDAYKRYYAFGDAAQQTVSTDQRYRYTGKPFDDEGAFDLYYYGARYYDPKLGRFIAVDPLAGKYPGWSPYVYTLDNPMKFVDPDGLGTRESKISTHVRIETTPTQIKREYSPDLQTPHAGTINDVRMVNEACRTGLYTTTNMVNTAAGSAAIPATLARSRRAMVVLATTYVVTEYLKAIIDPSKTDISEAHTEALKFALNEALSAVTFNQGTMWDAAMDLIVDQLLNMIIQPSEPEQEEEEEDYEASEDN